MHFSCHEPCASHEWTMCMTWSMRTWHDMAWQASCHEPSASHHPIAGAARWMHMYHVYDMYDMYGMYRWHHMDDSLLCHKTECYVLNGMCDTCYHWVIRLNGMCDTRGVVIDHSPRSVPPIVLVSSCLFSYGPMALLSSCVLYVTAYRFQMSDTSHWHAWRKLIDCVWHRLQHRLCGIAYNIDCVA